MMDQTYPLRRRLRTSTQWFIGGGVVLLSFVQLLGIPFVAVCAVILAVGCAAITLRRSDWLLYLIYFFVILSRFVERGPGEGGIGIVEVVGALVLSVSVLYVLWGALVERRFRYFHPALIPVAVTAAWGLIVAVPEIVEGTVLPEFWIREFLAFWPLIAVPMLYRDAIRDERFERRFFIVLIVVWFMVQLLAAYHIRSTMVAATFLYETGVSRVAVVGTTMMFFVYLIVIATTPRAGAVKWYIGGLALSIVGFWLTNERTVWLTNALLIPLFALWIPRPERRRVIRSLLVLLSMFAVFAVTLYLTAPLFRAYVGYMWEHLATSKQVGTDPSLYNRYVEWRYVIKQILNTPITGVGFGGVYRVYVWVGGFTAMTGYTHNTFLGWLLKFGVVGFLLMLTSFVSLMAVGFKLSYSRFLSRREQLLSRAAVAVLVFCIARFMISNMFNSRDEILYLALVWAFLIVRFEKHTAARALAGYDATGGHTSSDL